MDETENRPAGRFWINAIEIDAEGLQVHKDGHVTALEPKVMQVLVELAAHAGEVVTRQYLIETIWQVSYGGDESLTRAISILRKTLGEGASARRLIETVPRRGYRLNAEVRSAERGREAETASPDASAVPASPEAALPPISIRRSTQHRRVGFGHVAVGLAVVLLAGLVAMLTLRPSETDTGSVLASLEIDAATEAALLEEASGFATGLDRANSVWRVFESPDGPAQYIFGLARLQNTDAVSYQLTLSQTGIEEPLFRTAISADDLPGDIFGERLVLLASHLMKCGDDLISAMSLDQGADPRLLGMLFELCHTNGGTMSREPADQVSARMRDMFPDDPAVGALHAVLILAKPDQHWMGQRDIRQPEIQREARRLLDAARQSEGAERIVEMGDILLAAKQADLAEQEKLLSGIGPSDWLGLGAVTLRNAMLRRAGRLTEAEYLLTTAAAGWPDYFELQGALAIVQAQKGSYQAAEATIEEGLRLAPDNIMLARLQDIYHTLYGDPEKAREALQLAPPAIRDCLTHFLDVRIGKNDRIGPECEGQDISQRARSLAIVGEYERAFSLIELFDPQAPGLGMVLHYSEFRPLWKEDRMWDVAEDFGLIDYWLETETRPDMCFEEEFMQICAEKL